jgi:ribosome-binding factor A
MHTYKRAVRVGERLQQELSKIIQEMAPEHGLGFVTLTSLKLTDDLLDARVFFSVLGDEAEMVKTGETLASLTPQIRHRIATSVELRRVPRLVFEYDETPARAQKVFSILEKLHKESEPEKP